jgi:MoaA/NifB/PqqE/SkfB family radical SAM enzyme
MIDKMAPTTTCTLTGGEPTLRTDLPDLIRTVMNSAGGQLRLRVQTNAIRLDKKERLRGIELSPRLTFFVSYHATDAETYDLCTGSKAMLDRARAGIVNLLEAGHHVVLSIVANAVNTPHLIDWVEDVASRFASLGTVGVHFSTTLCPDHRPQAEEWLVDYELLAPQLERAHERALALGLVAEPLLSSTHASIPACFLSSPFRTRRGSGVIIEPRVVSSESAARGDEGDWVKPSRCDQCSCTSTCQGVPRAYANRFGLDALRPIP